MKKLFVVLLVLLLCQNGMAQNNTFLIKPDKGTVLFVGDSITAWKRYDALVESYLRSRFPEKDFQYRNLGRSGDTTYFLKRGGVVNGFNRDIKPLNPSVVFINLGINDTHRGLEHVDESYRSLKQLIGLCQSVGAQVIVLSPNCYDGKEAGEPAGNPKNRILEKYVEAICRAAEETGCVYIDLYHPYLNIIEKSRRQGAEEFVLNRDGTHPDWRGHFIIAWTILKGLNAPPLVSTAALDVHSMSVSAENCQVRMFRKVRTGEYQFERDDECLPWPLLPHCFEHLELNQAILDDLSLYTLKLTGLPTEKQYDLYIDEHFCCRFSGGELEKGVNLTHRAGPITKQNRMLMFFIGESRELYYTRWRRIQLSEFPVDYRTKHYRQYLNNALLKVDEGLDELERALRELSRPQDHIFRIKQIEEK